MATGVVSCGFQYSHMPSVWYIPEVTYSFFFHMPDVWISHALLSPSAVIVRHCDMLFRAFWRGI